MNNTMEEEDASEEVRVENFGDPLTAENYAAEAMAADMDPWIKFDSRKTPRAEFDSWLESNKPSQVKRFGDDHRGPVGWISVLGPDFGPSAKDITSLQENWECLLASGRPVNFQSVKELALNGTPANLFIHTDERLISYCRYMTVKCQLYKVHY